MNRHCGALVRFLRRRATTPNECRRNHVDVVPAAHETRRETLRKLGGAVDIRAKRVATNHNREWWVSTLRCTSC